MKILTRPINKGETFPCAFQKAKEIFKHMNVCLNFAHGHRDYGTFSNTPDRFYMDKNIKGRVISSMYMQQAEDEPLLCFYVLKESQYNKQLRDEFEDKYLPMYAMFFDELYQQKRTSGETYVMIVELISGELRLHKYKFR